MVYRVTQTLPCSSVTGDVQEDKKLSPITDQIVAKRHSYDMNLHFDEQIDSTRPNRNPNFFVHHRDSPPMSNRYDRHHYIS